LPALAERHGVNVPMMRAIAPSNEHQAEWLLDRLEEELGVPIRGLRIALLGLPFKADTDDLRESPALRLGAATAGRGAALTWFDPLVTASGDAALRAAGVSAERAASADAACHDADAVIVATEWSDFSILDWQRIAPTMRGRVVLDARSVVDVDAATRAGIRVLSLGVPVAAAPDTTETKSESQQVAVATGTGSR
jgi:UDPglucose 6-dehydrogenase